MVLKGMVLWGVFLFLVLVRGAVELTGFDPGKTLFLGVGWSSLGPGERFTLEKTIFDNWMQKR